MPTLFTIEHLNICIGDSKILKDVSFAINEGELLGVIGPNGSGKSTLMRSLAGILKPVSGSIKLNGKEVSQIPRKELARKIAVVPQDSPIAFNYTVMEVVLMGRSPYMNRFETETENDIEIASNALIKSNLADLADRNAENLSGGERQRVMVARALAQESEIIFLDEPTAHLDINNQVEVLHLVKREITENGKTGLVVLHDLNLAAEFCDKLLMLNDGKVFDFGVPDEVITAENVQKVYGTAVLVKKHPTSGKPYVLSIGSQAIALRMSVHPNDDIPKIHVISGGGSGSFLYVKLIELDCDVTSGVINIGDTDQETAETLGIEYVEDAPFSPISKAAHQANISFINKSDAVLIGNVPFGSGNIANLHAAVYAIDNGKPVAIVSDDVNGFTDRDFVDGKVVEIFEMLISKGAILLKSDDDIVRWVDKIKSV